MEELKEDLNVLEFRKEYEETILKPKKDIASKPKSARGRKKKNNRIKIVLIKMYYFIEECNQRPKRHREYKKLFK